MNELRGCHRAKRRNHQAGDDRFPTILLTLTAALLLRSLSNKNLIVLGHGTARRYVPLRNKGRLQTPYGTHIDVELMQLPAGKLVDKA